MVDVVERHPRADRADLVLPDALGSLREPAIVLHEADATHVLVAQKEEYAQNDQYAEHKDRDGDFYRIFYFHNTRHYTIFMK